MLVRGLVAVVSGFNDWVEELFKDFIRLFVTGDATDGHDEGMAGVVDASLDGMVDGIAGGSLLGSHALVHLKSQHVGHVVVVLLEVGILILGSVL